MSNHYQQVREFHENFDPEKQDKPTKLSIEEAEYRAGFKMEEVLEFLYAANEGNATNFDKSVAYLKEKMEEEAAQIKQQEKEIDVLTDEVDALIDLLYFTYGTFVKMGIDPTNIFKVVHEANMGKLFPDGKPRYHEITGKVLKPKNWEKDFAPEKKIKAEIEKQK